MVLDWSNRPCIEVSFFRKRPVAGGSCLLNSEIKEYTTQITNFPAELSADVRTIHPARLQPNFQAHYPVNSQALSPVNLQIRL